MRPLEELSAEAARGLRGLVFDLDDTLLDHGALTEKAYGALFRLKESGLALVACTGRPASWVHIAMRQWPIDAGIAENGGIAVERDGRTRVKIDARSVEERARRRERLLAIAAELRRDHPRLAFTDDFGGRISDVTLDVGEHVTLAAPEVGEIVAKARALGARTSVSSIHLHLTFDADDKGSAAIAACVRRGFDPTAARRQFAFAGDNGNDAAAFAAFHTTFAVHNVRAHVARLSLRPRYVARAPYGAGFAEIAARLALLRR